MGDWNYLSSDLHAAAIKPEAVMEPGLRLYCDMCDSIDFDSGDDGFYYCRGCGSQSQDVVDTGCADEDIFGDAPGAIGAIYNVFRHRAQPQSQTLPTINKEDLLRSLSQSLVKNEQTEEKTLPYRFEDDNPAEPMDIGADPALDADALASGIRLRYVQGLQVILQLQCEALVEKFDVSPMICGLASTIWLRYVASSRVFDEGWGKKVIAESEAAAAQSKGDTVVEKKPSKKTKAKYVEPRNAYGRRSIYIWLRALRKTIPLYSSLAISVLVCHISREAILPTDIHKWASEAKLPYLTAFLLLNKFLGSPLHSCPLSSRLLFRPVRMIGSWQLEAAAGSIARKIGLHLPSVNFYAIASRYLKDLSLPIDKILPHACRLYEWSIPADLWLSSETNRLPTRVCVMAILIVTIRVLYNIHGQGFWEMTHNPDTGDDASTNQTLDSGGFRLSPAGKFVGQAMDAKECDFTKGSTEINHVSQIGISDFNPKELLEILQATFERISTGHDYSRDLQSYLKYCRDVIFAGMTNSYDEEILIERLWEIYETQEDDIQPEEVKCEFLDPKCEIQRCEVTAASFSEFKELREQRQSSQQANREISCDDHLGTASSYGCMINPTHHLANNYGCIMDSTFPDGKPATFNSSATPSRNAAVEKMKLSMEENGFLYLPPRSRKWRGGYIQYSRKKLGGKGTFVAHADYYIVLQACAKLAEVDMRMMQLGVLKFERRLAWIEQGIDGSLNAFPEIVQQMRDK